MARQQLRLIETPATHKLDERTKAIGRMGLISARAALAEADQRRAARDGTANPTRSSAA